MLFLRVSSILCLFAANIRASSHWMVTESGLIEPKDESPFLLTKPDDLLTFMNQETRWQNTHNIYHDLRSRLEMINSLWKELEEQSDISSYIVKNKHCQAAGDIENRDWFTGVVEDGKSLGVLEKEFLLYTIEDFKEIDVPDCKKISSLTFSMSTFEHLEGVMNRGHLNGTPETPQTEIFSSVRTVKQYGHWLTEVLRRNTTSWLHYNLAAIYWRIKGNAPKALECSRRAVHYAPRRYKTVPLLCMGSILHRSKKTEDAIIVFGASVDHAPKFSLSHFALGEALAVTGDFNNSLKHLNMSIELRDNFAQAKKYQNAVLCHIDMLTKMQYAQRTLAKLAVEIKACGKIELKSFSIHAAILNTMHHNTEFSRQINVDKNCKKMEALTGLKLKHLHKDRTRNAIILYLATNPQYTEVWSKEKGVKALAIAYDFEREVKRILKQSGPVNKSLMAYNLLEKDEAEILKEIGPMPPFPEMHANSKKFSETDRSGIDIKEANKRFQQENIETFKHGKILYPSNMKVNRNKMDFDTDPEWPSNNYCTAARPDFPDDIEAVYPVFMPFEHKGLSVEHLLTDQVGVSALHEHELPWHPPLCPNDKELATYTSKKGIKINHSVEAVNNEYLRLILIMYVSRAEFHLIKNMEDAEIGQRIHTAMQKKLAPKWVLYTLASLYWRVRGNSAHAINCLLGAQRGAHAGARDVALVSLGSVLLEAGLCDDALVAAEEAYKLSPYEPPTNFLLSQVHMVKKQQKAQLFHLKQTLRVDPKFMGGRARSVLDSWACIAKEFNSFKDDESSNTLVRMLDTFKEDMHGPLFTNKQLEETFYKVVNAKPLNRHDKPGHLRSYDVMMRTVVEQIGLCKMDECGVTFDMLDLNKEDCQFNGFEFEYWLLLVCFQQNLSDDEYQILMKISRLTPSKIKTPECEIPEGATRDFYLSRMLAIDSAGWGALLLLVQHFVRLLGHADFVLIGARLSKYVETNPGCWWGAMMAGWWCGAVGRGGCAARCLAAARARAPPHAARRVMRTLVALLHLQNKEKDALDLAYLSFYASPKSKVEAFLLGLSHFENQDIEEALWMFRYALAQDYNYFPATACIHSVLCYLAFEKYEFKKTQMKLISYKKEYHTFLM